MKKHKLWENENKHLELCIEGVGLKEVLGTSGIVPYFTKSNSVMEVNEVLGIEAASIILDFFFRIEF